MKYLLFPVILFVFIISCSQERDKSIDEFDSKINSEASTKVEEGRKASSANLITYFKDFQGDSLKIEVESYTHDKTFDPSECLPLSFVPLFGNHIPQTQTESTGAKPVGKTHLKDDLYLLVMVQQDDYGPIYYAVIYNTKENKIYKSEPVAQSWGDAGDSQETYSTISMIDEKVLIKKSITTCHEDLEIKGEEVIATNPDCKDSTATIQIEI